MTIVTVGCIITFIVLGIIIMVYSAIDEEITVTLFGLIVSSFGVVGLLGLKELAYSDNSQYVPAEPLAYNQTQTVFTTDEGIYLADGLYPDGTYLLTIDSKDILVVWQAVDGEVG